MSKGIIQDKINQIATETEFEGVTHVEVAELLTLINNDKVDKTEAVAYESGFQGSITPDTLPASGWIPGIYTAEVSGTYPNQGGIVVNLNDGFTALIYNGTTWSKIVLPIDVNGLVPDWSDEEMGLQFPKTRIFENFLYRVKPGQTATSADVPGISDKWELLNEHLDDSDEFLFKRESPSGVMVVGIRKDGSLASKTITDIDLKLRKVKAITDNFSVENSDFIQAIIDRKGKVIFALDPEGNIINKNIQEQNKNIKNLLSTTSIFTETENEEFIQTLTDKKDNILSARKADGSLIEKQVEAQTLIVKESLLFEKNSIESLITQLKASNFSPSAGKSNKSDDTSVYLPFPETIAHINFNVASSQLPVGKPTEVKLTFEYWDAYGNYLKKPGVISVQGTSSSGHTRKNFTLDVDDGSTLKWGSMLESDSFYLKSFYTDSFRGQSIAMYKLYMDIINSRPVPERKAFYNLYAAPSLATGTGKFIYDMSSGATYIANGFPIALYLKGEFYGVYTVVQKKNRANYDMKKSNKYEIWLDGLLDWNFFLNNIIWTNFELRNPTVKNMDGSNYSGDNPQEIQEGITKTYIQNFASRMQAINGQSTTELKRAEFLKYFDLNSIIDYFLFSNVIYNFDGFGKNWQWYTKDGTKWAIGIHDLDNIFGLSWRGEFILIDDILTNVLGTATWMPTYVCTTIFLSETKARYNELKALKLLDANTIADRIKKWLDSITAPMLNADLSKWPETPSYRDGKINRTYWEVYKMTADTIPGVSNWNATTNYTAGQSVRVVLTDDTYIFRALKDNTNQNPITGNYTNYPFNLGFYNSIDRVRKTVVARLALLESTLGI